ncbi:S-m checkpoint control protein [Globisporangium polare]
MSGDPLGWPTRKADAATGVSQQQQHGGWPADLSRAATPNGPSDAMRLPPPGYMSPPPGSQPPPFPQQQQQQQQRQPMRRDLPFEPQPGPFSDFQQQPYAPPPPVHMQQQQQSRENVFDLGGRGTPGNSSLGMGFALGGPPLPGTNLLSSSPLDNGTPLHGLGLHSRPMPPQSPHPPQMGLGLGLGLDLGFVGGGGGPVLGGGHPPSHFLGMLPPPGGTLSDLSGPQALYHLQFQQQRHNQHQQHPPGRGLGQDQGFGLPPQQGGPLGGRFPGHQEQQIPQQSLPPPPASHFDLSHSLLQMSLGANNQSSGSIGSIGSGSSGSFADSTGSSTSSFDPFASWASASSSSTSSTVSSGVSLRDQMNQQMAALYQRDAVAANSHNRAPSGLSLLNDSREFGHSTSAFPDLPDLTSLGSAPIPPQHQQQYRGTTSIPQQQPPLMGGINSTRQSRRSPGKPPGAYPVSREQGGFNKSSRLDAKGMPMGGGNGNGGDFTSSIEVSPEVTKPNGNIKVQVSLLAEECSHGRVLMVGLFRGGQMTNERPIFVKQVLFENKLNRNYRFLNTRITFRAPRSPGEFEFRVFESKKTVNGMDDRSGDGTSYSNVTIARSNKLKVNMEYSHFIEMLRGTNDKFRGGIQEGDSGAIMSSLLSILRLVDQVETVFLHGNVLFSEFVESCLQLLALSESTISGIFAATEAVPNVMESLHGTMRNVLNGIQANPFVRELIADEILRKVSVFQREFYCQASGFYFPRPAERDAYWQRHFGFAPFAFSSSDEQGQTLLNSPFVKDELSQWIVSEAQQLIPEKDEFRRSRQEIYNTIHANVVSRLPIKADLDVFGSSANDFGTSESDMDMCLVLEKSAVTTEEKQQILRVVVVLLERQPQLFTDIDASRLTARIPIVMFKMTASGTECDLCIENVLAQRNTAFLRAYANADERVRVLAYVLKRFVKRRRMNSASESTLSSYGYLLMLIHYLQRQDPPVLPVLQALPPTWDGSAKCDCTPTRVWCGLQSPACSLSERHVDMRLPSVLAKGPADDNESASNSTTRVGKVETYFFDPFAFQDPAQKLQLLQTFGSRNRQSVGELLVGFFEYFGLQFDASRQVVSVRMARTLSKEEKKRESQWRMHTRLSIEDPFEVSYDVAHVLKSSRDKYIRQQFAWAYTRLVQGALDASGDSNSEGDSVAKIMAMLNEEVQEPAFLQPGANVSTATTGDEEAAGAGGNDDNELTGVGDQRAQQQ